ncbi:TPA: MFS transporter [Streptococcus suis]|nr:MFS transporter [Streptococcus suis]HEM6196969.1 MFS transporter [Streptococcus suis]HEP1779653.1 MFS transporter [Streptococcus suis]HEP1781767.1 MFS transporter [Streptococcus suis]
MIMQDKIDSSIYNRSKISTIVLSQLHSISSMLFFTLLTYMSYLANVGYGITVVVSGFILTNTRIFDGLIDPLLALMIDRFKSPFGKLRIFMALGWLIRALSIYLLFVLGIDNQLGIIFFICTYLLFICGSSISDISGSMIGAVLTNDPKQRGILQLVSTLYSYLTPLLTILYVTIILLPKFNNTYSEALLSNLALKLLPLTLLFTILSIISLSKIDTPERFRGLDRSFQLGKIGWNDVFDILIRDKSFQKLLATSIFTKFAQQISGQTIVTTLLYGIVLGNYQLGTIINTISLLPSLFIGMFILRYIERYGAKKISYYSMLANIVFLFMSAISVFYSKAGISIENPIYACFFFFLQLLTNASNMILIITNGILKNDMVDYELYRTGKYFPAVINGVFNFLDQFVSSATTLVIAGIISFVGYQDTIPQPSDRFTVEKKWITLLICFGFPILCNLISVYFMRNLRMDKFEMQYIQQRIFHKRTS